MKRELIGAKRYYIVSKKHMRRNDQNFLLWGPNFCGYTTNVDKAGRYTESEVREKYGDYFPVVEDFISFIDRKMENFLIPADDEEALEQIGLRKVTVITFR